MARRLAQLIGRAAATLGRHQRLARRLLQLTRLVPGRGRRSRVYLVFSWPLGSGISERYEVGTVGGRMLVDPQTLLGRVLAVSGEWEPHITAAFRGRLTAGDVCVDVGAHIGYYTLLASSAVGRSGHVYALEPSSRVYRTLSSNLALNASANVTAFNLAAGETTGSGVLYEAPGPSPLTSSLSPRMLDAPHGARAEDFVATEVQVVAVDDIVPAEDFRRVRMVKIDVEGYEIEVLRGMEGLLRAADRIAIFVETSPEWTTEDPVRFLTEFCNEHALSAYVLRNDYSLEGYFPRRLLPPVPVRTIPPERQDLMLVRLNPGRADGDLRRDA
jgi:FkbM family methyltransferase